MFFIFKTLFMKRKHEILTGICWILLQNGLLAQGSLLQGDRPPATPSDRVIGKQFSPLSPEKKENMIAACCGKILVDKRRIYYLTSWNYQVILQLRGVYCQADVLYLKVKLINRSGVDYTIVSLRFSSRETQHETGEDQLKPLYIHGYAPKIRSQSSEIIVVAFPKFSLTGKNHLDIELFEKSGGRHLRLKVGKRAILRARFV